MRKAIFWILFVSWIILLIGLTSCDPIKRHSRLVERFPHVHTQDTLVIIDTIKAVIPAEKADTIVHFKTLRDTLYIDKDRVRVRIHTILDSVYVEAECKEVIVEKIVERKIPIIHYKDKIKNDYVRWIIFGLILFLILFRLLKNKS